MLAPCPFSKLVSSPEFPRKLGVPIFTQLQQFKTWTYFILFFSFVSQILIMSLVKLVHTNTTPNTLLYFKRYFICLLKFSRNSVLPSLSRISHHLLHNLVWKNKFVKCNVYKVLEKYKQWRYIKHKIYFIRSKKENHIK